MGVLVLTVIGDDRPGLVHALAEVVRSRGGNWERSEMSQLAGTFAGIVEVSVPDDAALELLEGLRSLEGMLQVTARAGREDTPRGGVRFGLDLVGGDRAGIVEEITKVLAQAGIDVGTLATESSDAPMTGGRIFTARARLEAPAGTDLAAVRSRLEELARDLMVDLSLTDHD